MVRRDPQTGKFVASAGEERSHTVLGRLNSEIPAADNSGGVTTQQVEGEDAEIVDFNEVVDGDEIFHLRRFILSATLWMPTTATAESSGYVSYGISGSLGRPGPVHTSPTHFSGAIGQQEGIVDLSQSSVHDDSVIYAGVLATEASHSDTTNNVSGGGFGQTDQRVFHFNEGEFVFDADDELVVPHEIETENVSDHAIQAMWMLTLHGTIEELD